MLWRHSETTAPWQGSQVAGSLMSMAAAAGEGAPAGASAFAGASARWHAAARDTSEIT
jgi:hypothetical protein